MTHKISGLFFHACSEANGTEEPVIVGFTVFISVVSYSRIALNRISDQAA
jgi:hypothetical protein